jgi:hypothetical protein
MHRFSVCHIDALANRVRKDVVIPTAKRRNLLLAGSEHTAGDCGFLTAKDTVRNEKARVITIRLIEIHSLTSPRCDI